MPENGHFIFQTSWGNAGIAWSSAGVAEIALPYHGDGLIESRLGPLFVSRLPPPWIEEVVCEIQTHFDGTVGSFERIPIDLDSLPRFTRSALLAARAIPPGTLITYGDLAKRMGRPESARAIGQALSRNPVPLIVPCHRVVGQGRRPVGFTAPGGIDTKRRLLAIEGIELSRM